MRTFNVSGFARSHLVIFAAIAISGCRSVSTGSGSADDRSDGGRIPSCLAEDGIDLFAAEGDEVLGITWNNLGESDAEGGYRVRFGTSVEDLSDEVLSDCSDLECELNLTGLENNVTYTLQIESLNIDGETTQVSCAIEATPHPLAFLADVRVHRETNGTQDLPDIIAGEEGSPLLVAWEDGGAIRLSRSDDLGDTWRQTITVGSGVEQSQPALAFRNLVEETAVVEDGTETTTVVEVPFLFLAYARGSQIMLVRAGFLNGLAGDASFDTPLALATGANPDIVVGPSAVHVAFEDGGQIFVVSLDPDTLSLETPVRVDTGSGEADAPAVTAHSETGDVYVAYHARRGAGDFNVYSNVSTDGGTTFGAEEARIDDDTKGQNQLNISIAVDERSNQLLATWEDRRGGANIFFASSEDNGLTWGTNIETGAGLAGDQFTPKAVVDPGRNSYVVFIDTSDGHRPMFSRFNPDRTFDPPLPVSTAAGKAGATARNPAVAIDKFGSIFVTWSENRGSPNVDVYFARAE